MKAVWRVLTASLVCMLFFSVTAFSEADFGKDVVVAAGKTVNDVAAFGGTLTVRGTVSGNAAAFGGDVIVEPGGKVTGDAAAIGGKVVVRDGASIGGDAASVGGIIDVAPSGSIAGERTQVGCNGNQCSRFAGDIARMIFLGPFGAVFGAVGAMFAILFGIAFFIARMLVWFGLAVLFHSLLPARVGVMADTVRSHFWRAFFYGVLCIVVIPLLLLSLLVSLIGIPLIPLTIISLILIYYYGAAGIALWAGRLLPNGASRSGIGNIMLGVLVISLIRLVPGIGLLVWLLMASVSFGIVLISRFGGAPAPSTPA